MEAYAIPSMPRFAERLMAFSERRKMHLERAEEQSDEATISPSSSRPTGTKKTRRSGFHGLMESLEFVTRLREDYFVSSAGLAIMNRESLLNALMSYALLLSISLATMASTQAGALAPRPDHVSAVLAGLKNF